MIRAVIFDFGRVISAQKPDSLFRGYEDDLGLSPGTINRIMFESPAWKDALIGQMTLEEFWRVIGPELGLTTPDEIHTFKERYRADEAINKEVLNLIRRLKGQYKLAVLSNSPPGLEKWLAEWHMLDLFDVVLCSGDEGVVKPNPVAFERTLKRLDVEPHEAVFIDDVGENVEAAHELGIHGIFFVNSEALAKDIEHLLSVATSKG